MRCGSCTREIPGEFRFCPFCGTEQAAACASCGGKLAEGYAFCPQCGAPRGSTPPRRARSSSAITREVARPAQLASARPGERRVVTVLFADVVGFTKLSERYDAEIITEMMNRLFERFGAVVRRYEGMVDKFIGDAAMILFGAPTAHEDDAERAVLTARDMMALLPAVNEDFRRSLGVDPQIAIHVGIATGLVVAGSVGSVEGGGYTVMGDTVNLASRLVDLAPSGEIYIAEATERLVGGRVRAEPIQTMHVKGKDEPVMVYRVTGADPAAGDSRGLSAFYSPMVARDRELSALRDAFRSLEEGRGSLITIDGAAGLGKSRLVRECLHGVQICGMTPRVHAGRCISYGRSVPYYPWGQVLASLLTESVIHRLGSHHLQVLQEVATGAFSNRTPADAEKHRETVFWSFARLIEASAHAMPRVIVLEDMHWADATSVDLALSLGPVIAGVRILLLVVFRPGAGVDLRARIRHAQSETPSFHLELPPLTAVETRLLVDNLTCNVAGIEDSLRQAIVERSEGVPLYVEEILRNYVDEGILTRDGELWRFDAHRAAMAEASIPTTLHALLAARIDRLPESERRRLDLAAVIRKDFDARMVDRLLGLPYDISVWQRLVDASEILPSPDPAGGPARYRFAHVLTQEVIYGTLLRVRRQELHLCVAQALESDERTQEENLHPLAWHFEQAGHPERAAPYWLAAARQAVAVYGNEEALELYDRANQVAPSATAAREALSGKVTLLMSMGRNAEAAPPLEKLVEMAQVAGDVAEEARLLGRRAMLAYSMGDGAGIIRFAEAALARARACGDARVVAQALRRVGVGHEFAGRFGKAQRAYRELLAIEEPFEESDLVMATYNSMGEIARALESYEEALSWYEKARAAHERRSPGAPYLSYLGNAGAAYVGLGDQEQGKELLDRCIAERTRTGYKAFLSESYVYRGLSHLRSGRLVPAADDARTALDLARVNREAEMEALALRLVAEVREAGGSLAIEGIDADPIAAMAASVRILHESGKQVEEARSRRELGRMLHRLGRNEEASAELDQASALLSRLGLDDLAARLLEESGEILIADEDG